MRAGRYPSRLLARDFLTKSLRTATVTTHFRVGLGSRTRAWTTRRAWRSTKARKIPASMNRRTLVSLDSGASDARTDSSGKKSMFALVTFEYIVPLENALPHVADHRAY